MLSFLKRFFSESKNTANQSKTNEPTTKATTTTAHDCKMYESEIDEIKHRLATYDQRIGLMIRQTSDLLDRYDHLFDDIIRYLREHAEYRHSILDECKSPLTHTNRQLELTRSDTLMSLTNDKCAYETKSSHLELICTSNDTEPSRLAEQQQTDNRRTELTKSETLMSLSSFMDACSSQHVDENNNKVESISTSDEPYESDMVNRSPIWQHPIESNDRLINFLDLISNHRNNYQDGDNDYDDVSHQRRKFENIRSFLFNDFKYDLSKP